MCRTVSARKASPLVSPFPSAGPSAAASVERAPPAAAWHREEPSTGPHSPQEPDHREPQHSETGVAADVTGASIEQPVSPSPTEGSSLTHSNAELSLRQPGMSSQSGSVAASEDAQQRRDGSRAENAHDRASEEEVVEATAPTHEHAEFDRVEQAAKAVGAARRVDDLQRSPRRVQHGRNDENAPQGRGWFGAGPKRGSRDDAVSAAQKLDFESARPSPIAPLGKAAAANWLRSRH